MKVETLDQLYVEQLKDLFSAESQLTEVLPKMAKAAAAHTLQTAFEEHLEETKQHRSRIEQIFKGLDYKPRGERCEAMAGLVEEGEEVVKDQDSGPVRDAALIAAAQRVEHYEIAGYGTVCRYAELLGRGEDVKTLRSTLEEERAADGKLNELANTHLNQLAKAASAS